jgi:nitrogen regulatory protein PII
MRLLKAFIRRDRVDAVIRALSAAKTPGLTVSRVHGVGFGYEPLSTLSMSAHELPKTQEVAKVEVVRSPGSPSP